MPMVRTIKAGKTPEEWEQQPAKNAQKDKDESFRPAPTPVHPGSHAQSVDHEKLLVPSIATQRMASS
jgi:hypothetical protein